MQIDTMQELLEFSNFRNVKMSEHHKIGLQVEMDIEDLFRNYDEHCEFKTGDIVEKATYEWGDLHHEGTKGTVVSCYYLRKEPVKELRQVYLVQFGDDPHQCLTLRYKLRKAK